MRKENSNGHKKIFEDFDDAYNRGDATGCATFFTDDVVLLAPGQPMIRDKAAFEEVYRARMNESDGGIHSNSLIEYGVDGDMAYQIGTYAVTGATPEEVGKFVNVLRRQPDGAWKVSVSIFNSDNP